MTTRAYNLPQPVSRIRVALTVLAAPFVAIPLLLLAGYLLARDLQAE